MEAEFDEEDENERWYWRLFGPADQVATLTGLSLCDAEAAGESAPPLLPPLGKGRSACPAKETAVVRELLPPPLLALRPPTGLARGGADPEGAEGEAICF